jgi:HAD superfamily hydrolase (TIGR01509 family)
MGKNVELQAIIFDLDGVIIDSHPAHYAAWKEFLRSLDREVSDNDLSYILDGRNRSDILRFFLGDLSECEVAEYGKRKDEFFQRTANDVQLIPGVIEFLEHLKQNDIAIAIATSAGHIRTHSMMSRLGLSQYFSTIVTANDVTLGKPDPAVYSLACERLNIKVKSALAFDDAASGVQAARAAGMKCVGVKNDNSHADLKAAGANLVIQDFVNITLDNLQTLFQ